MNSPLTAVLEQIGSGVGDISQMAKNTALPAELLQAALTHLIRTGQITADPLSGCPKTGCERCLCASKCEKLNARPPVWLRLSVAK
ncbi:MAG: hypothetical protein FWG47_01285 [Propionibacteriaceae bacterium]|nr:hypothetical protein [Propionibacteriaceae bacterium]